MIYLFNNVYLSPDRTVEVRPEDDSMFVSSIMRGSSFHVDNFFSTIYGVTFLPPLMIAASYDDVISQVGGSDMQLFELLMKPRANRLIIVCDEPSMIILLVKSLKTLLPHINGAAAWKLIKYTYLPFYLMYDNDLIQLMGPRTFDQLYVNLVSNEDDIMELWNDTSPWSVSPHQREFLQQTAGIELQTATYLVFPSWKYTTVYQDKVISFAKKTLLQMLVGDLRRKLLEGFMDIQKVMPGIDPLDPNVIEQLNAHPVYRFLIDPDFTPGNWEYVFDNYEISELHALFETYAPLRAFNLNDFSLLSKENDLTFDDVLQHELASQGGRSLIGVDPTHRTTVNVYVLDLFFDLYTGDRKQLRPYSLI